MKNSILLVQASANMYGAGLKLDGIQGPKTRDAVGKMPESGKSLLESTLEEHGQKLDEVLEGKRPSSDFTPDFSELVKRAQVILPKSGIDWRFGVAQWALESNWGRSVPKNRDGRSTYNFGGIKANSVGQYGGVTTSTSEFLGGKTIRTHASWAVFEDVDHFINSWLFYLLKGSSSYRYEKGFVQNNRSHHAFGRQQRMGITEARTIQEFAEVLSVGGYATDSRYVTTLTSMLNSVDRRFA